MTLTVAWIHTLGSREVVEEVLFEFVWALTLYVFLYGESERSAGWLMPFVMFFCSIWVARMIGIHIGTLDEADILAVPWRYIDL